MPNLFKALPTTLPDELIETLCYSEHVRIERIVSRGQSSPPEFWYNQDWHEFVILVSGRARLSFSGGRPPVELSPGDWLVIDAREPHRVDWTEPTQDTIWLAVHYR